LYKHRRTEAIHLCFVYLRRDDFNVTDFISSDYNTTDEYYILKTRWNYAAVATFEVFFISLAGNPGLPARNPSL
jgi:hypothetical protein